jgi:anti-anti-sigma factor
MIQIHTHYSAVPVVRVEGAVTGEDAGYLKSTLLELADSGYESIALLMSGIQAIDTVGIGALLATRARLSPIGGTLYLVNCTGRGADDLRNTGMTELFSCYERVEDIPQPR